MRAIGRVAAQWSIAQYVLEHLLWVLVPTDQATGKMLTTHLPDESRCNVILTLASKTPEATKEKIVKLLKTFDEIRKDRNRVIHNVWAGDVQDLARGFKPTARGSFRNNETFWSAPDIETMADEISDFTVDLMNMIQDDLWYPPPHAGFFEQLLAVTNLQRQQNQRQTEIHTVQPPPSET
jgi:hypothetical protein